MSYPAATLNFLSAKRKWYVYVTVPSELRSAFPKQTQVRRSTGTSDRREAERLLHGIAACIYAEFDSKKANPVLAKLEELEALVAKRAGADWHLYQLLKRDIGKREGAAADAIAMLKTLAEDAREEDLIAYDDEGVVVHYDASREPKLRLIEEISESLALKEDKELIFGAVAKEFLRDTSFSSTTMRIATTKALREF